MIRSDAVGSCRWCGEHMHSQAWRCPHCRMWQSRLQGLYMFPVLSPLLIIPGLAATWAVPLMLMLSPVMSEFEKGAPFADYHDQLRVVGSAMFTGYREGDPVIAVVGTLRNDTEVPWWALSLEVQFMDHDGKLVDVIREHLGWRTLLPAGQLAFRADMVAELPLGKYAAYEVFVRSGLEARRLF